MSKVDFQAPKGLQLPEGTQAGDKVELMAEFEVKDGGKLCIVSIEGADMPGYEDKADEDKSPSERPSKFMDAYKGAMGGMEG